MHYLVTVANDSASSVILPTLSAKLRTVSRIGSLCFNLCLVTYYNVSRFRMLMTYFRSYTDKAYVCTRKVFCVLHHSIYIYYFCHACYMAGA